MENIHTSIRKKELVAKKRSQIIEAANKLFCVNGFYKTTLKDISEEAGISQGSIYDYVSSKEDILYLIHAHMFEILTTSLHKSHHGIFDPIEKLQQIIYTELQIASKYSNSILLMYEETHNLGKLHRKNILKREKDHELIYENVIKDCVVKGLIAKVNPRIAANMLISMIHTNVIRRWDFVNDIATEEISQFIVKMFLYGLLLPKGKRREQKKIFNPLKERVIFIINRTNYFEKDLYSFLLSKGAHLAIYGNSLDEQTLHFPFKSEKVKFYSTKDFDKIDSCLFDQVFNDFGQISIIIQNVSIDFIKETSPSKIMHKLEQNFKCAEYLPVLLEKYMNQSGYSRFVYIAPWAWDKFDFPFNYDVVKAGVIALTKTMAERLAPSKINVNCVVPGLINGVRKVDVGKEKRPDMPLKLVPLNCTGTINDVLNAIYYFISDSSKYVTGQVLDVNGGMIWDYPQL